MKKPLEIEALFISDVHIGINYARERNFSGVIYGHTHIVENFKDEEGFHFLNCGDWVEDFSAIIYDKGQFAHVDGRSLK
jgi:UDP-2,3-diacylglucosamine pyrophosphatase LpxH